MQDIELLHMRYVLESAIFALGIMERCAAVVNNPQLHVAMSYLKDMQNHMEAIRNVPRRVSPFLRKLFINSCLRMPASILQ